MDPDVELLEKLQQKYIGADHGSPIIKKHSNSTVSKSFYFSLINFMKDLFLPQGFPKSVHPDYIPYQIWDTVQAFASTVMGTLTTHSIMKSVGVGESTATPLAAAITWILKDGTGMIGRILFAWWSGAELDRQCKKWRLFADILNDIAMGIELSLPYFASYAMTALCISTAMKSVVGVAGGATRAALTQHQALQNNLADVSAKDGSQETCVNLIASFVGIFILSYFHDERYLMELYFFLVVVHLYANYSAVKAICLNTFNEDRLALAIKHYLTDQEIPCPDELNKKESVLLFTNPTKSMCGFHIKMNVTVENMICCKHILYTTLDDSVLLFKNMKYILITDSECKSIYAFFEVNAGSCDMVKAYFHAYCVALFLSMKLKLPSQLLLSTQTSKLSIPLMRIYLLSKHSNWDSQQSLISNFLRSTPSINSLVDSEYKMFLDCVTKSGWITEPNLLPIGTQRYYEKFFR